jgi:hypothetical protein
MYSKSLAPWILGAVLLVGVAQAAPITIENFSFELPGTGKQANFTNVPGWHTDTVAADSGTETGYTPTDGTYTAFLRGDPTDPALWQLTGHTIVYGDVFELKVDARLTYLATTLRMTLYYDVDGVRTVAATKDVTVTDTMTEFALTFDSKTLAASAGHKIGVQFANTTGAGTWLGIDRVRLELVKAGSTGGPLSPVPADEATDVPQDVVLTWTPGPWANTHNVYLGLSLDDVTNATAAAPRGALVSQGQDANSFEAGGLELGRTYFWRVDEVNAPPTSTVFKGSVWSFTVEPQSYPLAGSHITATASSISAAGMGPEKTIDGSGLNAVDEHSTDVMTMWLSAKGGPQPSWIQYQFDKLYSVDQLLIWNSNQTMEAYIGFGAKDVTIEYSLDGAAWTALGDFEVAQAPGTDEYKADTVVEFGAIAAGYVRLTAKSNWGGLIPQYGLSEVRFYTVPMAAREPTPAQDATAVAPEVTLSWRAGRQAATHQVYLSTDKQAVIDGVAPMSVAPNSSFDAVVNLGSTYYWKVVEVNQAETPAAWESELWSFSTADSILVEDFESYTDDEGSRIYEFWIDGYDDPANGSLVGYDIAPFAEQTIVHGGQQSMPLAFDNTAGVTNSEATLTFQDAQDWTKAAVETLVIFFYGAAGNPTNVPLWVKVTDQSNKKAKATFDGDMGALAEPAWTPWAIPLANLVGVNLARIKSIAIGLGAGSGAGQLFIDDIRLYPAMEVVMVPPAALVGHWKLDNDAQDNSGNGNNGTLTGGPTWAAAGRIGAALSLDGVDDYVNCGNGANLNITDKVTLSAWVKTGDAANSEHNPFVVKGDTSYALKHNTGNTIEFFIYDGTWYAANSAVLTTAFNNEWHHVAGTYDGVQLKVYVDGVLAGSRLHTGVIASAAYDVNIGRDAQNTTRLYKGLIDDVRIYQGALPKSEIVKLANP